MPEVQRPGETLNRSAGGGGPARLGRLCSPELGALDGARSAARWEVLEPEELPGLPAYVTALVGRCGTVLVSQLDQGGPLSVERGKLYCEPTAESPSPSHGLISLEDAVSEIGALANELSLRLSGRAPVPMVYAAVLVRGARSSLFHRDVLVTPPRGLVRGIEAFPAVQLPSAVTKSTADVKQAASEPLIVPAAVRGAGGAALLGDVPWGREGPEVKGCSPEEPWLTGALGAGAGETGTLAPGRRGVVEARRGKRRARRRPAGPVPVAWSLALLLSAGGAVAWYTASHLSSSANSENTAIAVTALPPASTAAGSSTPPAAGAGSATTAATGLPAFVPYVAYGGRQVGDVVAAATGTVQLAGATLSLAPPVVVPALRGQLLLCVRASVHDGGRAPLPYGPVDWAVRSPSGVVEHPFRMADNALLTRGQLVPGDSVRGQICFEEPGQAGLYVLTYSARGRHNRGATGSHSPRGVWLMRLPGP